MTSEWRRGRACPIDPLSESGTNNSTQIPADLTAATGSTSLLWLPCRMALLRTPRNGTVKIVEQGAGTPVVFLHSTVMQQEVSFQLPHADLHRFSTSD